jgi:hypothetical protein
MKRIICACVAILCMFLFIPHAHAEEVGITITATPSELTDSGTVDFTFYIDNHNPDYPMEDVTITYLGTVYDVLTGEVIPPDYHAENIVLSLSVSDAQLGNPIVFTLNWTSNGEPMTQEASVTVERAENPVIEVTRAADRENAKPGEEIVLTYTITNETKFDMTDITLIDENISDNPILQHDSLRASSSYSINYSYTMGDESAESTPFVTYTVNGKTKTYSSVAPLTLTMVLIQLDMDVDMGTPTPSGVTFSFDVKNTGSQTISDIRIVDERENRVNEEPFTLEANETHTLSYTVVPLMTEPLRNVQFSLTGTDSFGEPYALSPDNVYEVYPFVDESQINVTVVAETVTAWSVDAGALTTRVIITNHSTVELTSITVMETSIGVVKTFETLPAGETTFDQEIQLGSPRNLSFTVKGYDPTGTNRELASCLLPVAYGTEEAQETTAEATPAPNSGGNMTLFNDLSSAITKLLIVLGVMMLVAFVILVVLTAMEQARKPRRYDDDDDDDLGGYDAFFNIREDPIPEAKEYDQRPNQEEISYTKRMLALKDEGQAGTVNNGSNANRAETKQNDEHAAYKPPRQATGEHSATQRIPKQPEVDEAVDRLIETARSQYATQENSAKYRPSSQHQEKPATRTRQQSTNSEAHKKQSAPRVYDYRQRPKTQPRQKQPVTRVEKYPDGHERYDDWE